MFERIAYENIYNSKNNIYKLGNIPLIINIANPEYFFHLNKSSAIIIDISCKRKINTYY